MKKQNKKRLWAGLAFLAAFALWTGLVCCVDVQPIGPRGSAVGFAAFNGAFHQLTGVHWALYTITDCLGLIPVGIALGFAALGLTQLLQRKRLRRVDRSILALGGLYLAVLAAYLLFDHAAINARPVLVSGRLEASYPSSTTLLALGVLPAAMLQCRARIRNAAACRAIRGALAALTIFLVLGRLLSGVHWLSDILGSVLLSAGLVELYAFAADSPASH